MDVAARPVAPRIRARLALLALLAVVGACAGPSGSAGPSSVAPATVASTTTPSAHPSSTTSASTAAPPSAQASRSTAAPPSAAASAASIAPSTAPSSAQPSPTSLPTATPAPTTSTTPAPSAGWSALTATGTAPAAREDHTWTVDAEGKVAYLFGGRDGGKAFDDLWSFDLATDTWTRLQSGGEHPTARFGHTATWVPDVGLGVWAGQAGGAFFDDLWAYDPQTAAWRQLPATGDIPEKRYGSCAALGPDGRLWISHGFTDQGRFFDTRVYDFGAATWTDVTPREPRPVKRCLHDCLWTQTGKLLLFGGQTNGVPALGDLWSLTPGVGGPGVWSELPKAAPAPRQLYATAEAQGRAYVFGGSDIDLHRLDDLWSLDFTDLTWKPVAPDATTKPRARAGATLIADPARSRLLLWGGKTDEGSLDDLWQFALAIDG